VLSASNPVIGGGAGVAPSSGTRSGNTTVFGTTSGTLTSQNCVKFDASGNLVAQGTACVNGAVASFFADPSTGNDSNDCLAASAGGGHGPCLTLQRVVSVAITYDAGNVRPIINLAAGTFTSGATVAGALRGEATPTANPPGLSIVGAGSGSTTIDDTPLCGTLIASNHANVILSNLTIQHSGAGGCGGQGSAIFAEGLAFVALGADVKFGPTQGQHMHAEGGALIEITANYSIGGSAANHMAASTSGKIFNDGHVVTCTGAFAYTTFILAQSNSTILFLPGATFSGCGGTTGVKFQLVGGAILDAGGVSGLLATIPGSNNGQVDDSSRYSNPEPLATLGTCTSGSLNANSTDWKMLVTFGVAPGASCAINFAYSKPVAPVCVATTSAVGAVTLSVSTTQVVVTQAFVNGESLYVICRPLSWM
jgi:hypothetical protein